MKKEKKGKREERELSKFTKGIKRKQGQTTNKSGDRKKQQLTAPPGVSSKTVTSGTLSPTEILLTDVVTKPLLAVAVADAATDEAADLKAIQRVDNIFSFNLLHKLTSFAVLHSIRGLICRFKK